MFWFLAVAALLVVNMALQLMDVWTTVAALQAGGSEQNVFSRAIMESFGVNAWIAIKLAVTGAIGAWLWWLRDADEGAVKRSVLPAGAMAVWMGFVLVNNLQVLAAI